MCAMILAFALTLVLILVVSILYASGIVFAMFGITAVLFLEQKTSHIESTTGAQYKENQQLIHSLVCFLKKVELFNFY
jgi:hypothetical protein